MKLQTQKRFGSDIYAGQSLASSDRRASGSGMATSRQRAEVRRGSVRARVKFDCPVANSARASV